MNKWTNEPIYGLHQYWVTKTELALCRAILCMAYARSRNLWVCIRRPIHATKRNLSTLSPAVHDRKKEAEQEVSWYATIWINEQMRTDWTSLRKAMSCLNNLMVGTERQWKPSPSPSELLSIREVSLPCSIWAQQEELCAMRWASKVSSDKLFPLAEHNFFSFAFSVNLVVDAGTRQERIASLWKQWGDWKYTGGARAACVMHTKVLIPYSRKERTRKAKVAAVVHLISLTVNKDRDQSKISQTPGGCTGGRGFHDIVAH